MDAHSLLDEYRLESGIGDASPLSGDDVDALFVRAVQRSALAAVARAVAELEEGAVTPEGLARAEAARATCAAITRASVEERDKMLARLAAAGIAAEPIRSGEDPPSLQHHGYRVGLAPDSLEAAIEVAESEGFLRWQDWGRGGWEAFRRTGTGTTLVRPDEHTTRVTFSWRRPARRGPVARLFRPTEADCGFVDLPGPLWPAYYLVRPVRLAVERLTGRPAGGHLGPFLATPRSLVPGLLDLAGVSEADRVYDLGCGDGRVLAEAVRLRGCRAVGIERDAGLVERARRLLEEQGLAGDVRIEAGDAATANLDDATVVFLFLPMPVLRTLVPELLRDLKPGTRIIAHEQSPLDPSLSPQRSVPVIGEDGLTIAHLWTAGPQGA